MPASGAGAPTPNCRSAQLSMRVVSFEGASGHRFWQLAFRVRVFLPGAAGGFMLNPMPRTNGPIFLCARSERIYPVTSEPGP